VETPLIEFKNVTKRFDEKTVLDRINLTIHEDRITTVIGKSGSGKSVLLKHIIGLLAPDEGSILFKGRPIREMKESEWDGYRNQVSYMFQNNALFDSMTVFDNIALPLRQTTDLDRKQIRQKVLSKIEQMEITDAAFRYPSELSGGMQKRVALARALVTEPSIVLFDEPTTGQDPIRKNSILGMIAHYRKQLGFTAILISHDIPDVFLISDRLLLLWEGKIAFSGTYQGLMTLQHPMIDEFSRSLTSLREELTGLLPREIFRSRYAAVQGSGPVDTTVTAVLFGVRFDFLENAFLPQATVEVLKILGECINKYFGPLGCFSARHNHRRILTMMPHIGKEETLQLVDEIAARLHDESFPEMQVLAGGKIGVSQNFNIEVTAGINEMTSTDDIENIIGKCETNETVITKYLCGKGA